MAKRKVVEVEEKQAKPTEAGTVVNEKDHVVVGDQIYQRPDPVQPVEVAVNVTSPVYENLGLNTTKNE